MSRATAVYRARPSEAELADLLSQRLVATLGTLNRDGSVHLAYVLFDERDGRVYIETSSQTRKARNVDRTLEASIAVQGRSTSGRTLMVSMEGAARLIRGVDAHEINRRLRAKYIRPEILPDVDRAWQSLDDVAIEIAPRRRRSWTGAALQEATQEELSVPYGEIWMADG